MSIELRPEVPLLEQRYPSKYGKDFRLKLWPPEILAGGGESYQVEIIPVNHSDSVASVLVRYRSKFFLAVGDRQAQADLQQIALGGSVRHF